MNREEAGLCAACCGFLIFLIIMAALHESPPNDGTCLITNKEYLIQDEENLEFYASYDTNCQTNLTNIDEEDQQLFSYRFNGILTAKKYLTEVLMTNFNQSTQFACYYNYGRTLYIESKLIKLRCES